VGSWLMVNGDAIYGTRPWTIYGEGPTKVAAGSFQDTKTQEYTPEDFRFTTKGNNLYAIELAWPSGNEAVIRSLSESALKGLQVQTVALLGSSAPLTYKVQADGLHIQLPSKPTQGYAYAFRIALDHPPQ
jgi:alpha-L-fucosidase